VPRPSLYEYAGGEPAFLRLAAAHHARCLADPVLEHPFSHGAHPEHVPRLAAYWAEVLGGPPQYTSYSSHVAMMELHAGTGAPDDMGERFVAAFLNALDDAGLPDDPDFRAALHGYIVWATGSVMSCAAPGSTVPDEPIPHWDWDGLVP
jgi:hemoglobin